MAHQADKTTEVPLLQSSPSSGTASSFQTLGNIIVSIVGTGVLGLPFAFKVAGWAAGSLGVIIAGLSTCYCMLLLVSFPFFLLCLNLVFFTPQMQFCLFSFHHRLNCVSITRSLSMRLSMRLVGNLLVFELPPFISGSFELVIIDIKASHHA